MDELRFRKMAALSIVLLFFLDLAHSAGVGAGSVDVIILSGQSNMSGRGGVAAGHWDGLVPRQAAAPPGSVLRLNRELRWEEAREPLHRGVDAGTVGVGPGLVFASTLVRSRRLPRNTTVGLVPCAVAGTGMSRWAKGQPLYQTMIRRAEAAVAGTRGARLRALLWYQGESDANEEAPKYEARLKRLVADVRADLGVRNLPVFLVGINLRFSSAEVVRQAQKAVSRDVAGVYFVDALGLPVYADRVHLTTSAQAQLGELLAAAYIKQLLLRA